MSCCVVAIDSDGLIHYGYEDGLSVDKSQFVEDKKIRKLKNGDLILLTGTHRACIKLVHELNRVDNDIYQIPKEEWFMDKEDESEVEALLLCKSTEEIDSSAHCIRGPFESFEIRTPGYYAIGSGADTAKGVLWHMLSGKKTITERAARAALHKALEAACFVDKDCSLPITIETLEA